VDISDHGAADEDVLDGAQMGIFQLLDDLYLVELDVEVLVDALERAADLNIVFQLDRDLVVDERLEEAEE